MKTAHASKRGPGRRHVQNAKKTDHVKFKAIPSPLLMALLAHVTPQSEPGAAA